MTGPLLMEGQRAWNHDEGHASGYFHTYDALNIDPTYPYARKVHVFLPRSYTGDGQQYPVVYMNDGHTAFFQGGFHGATWDMAGLLADLYAQHMREVIVVAAHPVMRDREYTHTWWHGDECCLLPVYARYLARSRQPFLDRNYRTLSGVADTMILGASHGGLAAFYTAVRHPDTFGFAAALSPSFWAGADDASQFPRVISTLASLRESALLDDLGPYLVQSASQETRPSLFLDWGLKRHCHPCDEDMEERAAVRGREMAALLEKDFGYVSGRELFTHEEPEGEHAEWSWNLRVRRALRFFRPQEWM